MSKSLAPFRSFTATVLFGTLCGIVGLSAPAASARAQSPVTVNFEQLAPTTAANGGILTVKNCYQESGFLFTAAGFGCSTAISFAAYGFDAGFNSTVFTLNDPAASFIDITRVGGGAFSMQSLMLGAFDPAMTNVSLIGSLIGGGSMTTSCPTLAATGNFLRCSLTQFAGLSFTSIRLSSTSAAPYLSHYVFMDDLTFTTAASATTVPEPTTIALFGAGLFAVGAAARRRARA